MKSYANCIEFKWKLDFANQGPLSFSALSTTSKLEESLHKATIKRNGFGRNIIDSFKERRMGAWLEARICKFLTIAKGNRWNQSTESRTLLSIFLSAQVKGRPTEPKSKGLKSPVKSLNLLGQRETKAPFLSHFD